MSKRNTASIIIAAAVAFAATLGLASAGQRLSGSIYVAAGALARGGLGAVRASANNVEYLGCGVSSTLYSDGVRTRVLCYGYDGYRSTSCVSTKPQMIDTARGISDSSFINIYVDPMTGTECSNIDVTNDSRYQPRAL